MFSCCHETTRRHDFVNIDSDEEADMKVTSRAALTEDRVRTAKDGHVPPAEALRLLVEGNKRYASGQYVKKSTASLRSSLAEDGQNPMAAVIGCADSRCPLESIFDADPGDLFVLRNAGNAVTHAEGGTVGTLEYAVGALGTKLVLVLGHTKCGAIAGATKEMLSMQTDEKGMPKRSKSALEHYLSDLAPVAKRAMDQLGKGASKEEIAAHAIKVNVFHTIEKLLEFSEALREKVAKGEVQMHGAVYQIVSGEVEFLGQHPELQRLLGAQHRGIGA